MSSIPVLNIFCPHCSRYTALSIAPVHCPLKAEQFNGFHQALWDRGPSDQWWIGVCNNCVYPVLVHNSGDIIFPVALPSPTDDRIPESVRKDLDEAKRCQTVGASRACAVMARRAMQSACKDKGATKGNLVDQLHELAGKGTITTDLKEWADVVRWVGNDAAHPDGDEVTADDAEDMVKLAEQFLHVLYVTPAIAKAQRTRIGK